MLGTPQQTFHRVRYVSAVVVIASLLGSVLMIVIGVTKTIRAYYSYYQSYAGDIPAGDQMQVNQAIAFLIQSIDSFMVGLVLIIFSFGVYTLFIKKIELAEDSVFQWIQIRGINRLKSIIGEMIVIILFVKFLEIILLSAADLSFEMLVLPVGIILLALALKFMELKAGD